MADEFPLNLNVQGPTQLVNSGLNKVQLGAGSRVEGIEGEFEDELTLKLDDEELVNLATQWAAKYSGYEGKIQPRQESNETYYLGKQNDSLDTAGGNISANLLFEATETFLPAALSKNPEPVVYSDNTTEGTAISSDVKTMLQFHADTLVLRRKLNLMTRHWSVYFLGVMKHGWNKDIDDIESEVINPKNLVLDPEGYVDCYGDFVGKYLGERKTTTAADLAKLFPKHKAYIIVQANGQMATDVTYTEWWSDDFCFYTFKGKVLDKSKNPHFSYPKQVPLTDPTGAPSLDENGQPLTTEQQGNNHFARPKIPYTFLSVFSLGKQPHDITNLIEQNIPNQKRITRRTNQIDFNLAASNNSYAFSEDNFTQETAKQAATARSKGNPILIPSGSPIDKALMPLNAQEVPAAVFNELENSKKDLRSIYGVEGITSQPANEDTTARGMILNQQFDNTRIGGGIGDALEQVADNVFNWWVQLYYVYYDVPHFAAIMGQMKAVEYVQIQSQSLDRQLVISVSPDSMKPHDEITEMNQAMSLYEAGVLDPKTLLTMLNVPDPQKTAEMTVLWLLDKQAYLQLNFPEVAAQLQQIQQQNALTAAAATQMGQAAGGQGGAQAPPGQVPESTPPSTAASPASSSLSQVPITSQALPQ